MAHAPLSATTEQLHHLQQLAVALGDAVTLDQVVRAAMSSAMRLEGALRVGVALTQGAGRQLRFVSTDERRLAPAALRWCLIDAYSDLPLTQAVRNGQEVHLPTLDDVAASFPDIAERQRVLGTRSLVAVPLKREDKPIGGLLLAYDTECHHEPHEHEFLSAFAAQVAQAVHRGLAYHVQHSTSEQLQRSLMPHSLPDIEGLSLGSHYQPGGLNVDVGGDWYDVQPLPDGSVVVSLGDVMGKGVPTAIVMSEVRAAMRGYALLDPAPGTVLARLDRLVTSMAVTEQIVTMLYGVIDPVVDPGHTSMCLSIAGHHPPLLVPASGRPSVLDGELGPALGLGAGPWPENRVQMTSDMSVLFFSDGLVESRRTDLVSGVALLCDHIEAMDTRRRNPREMCARLAQLMFREDTDDDVTVLAAAVTASDRVRSATTRVPADASAPRLARRFLVGRLAEWGVDEDSRETAALCVSELVTNALIHSGTEAQVAVRVDDECVLVLVQDQGHRGAVQRASDYDALSVSGRGLTLIDALATAWSAEHNADGTTVWFELALQPAASWAS